MNEQQAHLAFNDALQCLNRAEPQKALDTLKALVSAFPHNPNVHFLLGVVKSMLGDNVAAIQCYDTVLSIQPDFVDAHINRAVDLYHLGDFKKSFSSAKRATELQPSNPVAWLALGNAQKSLEFFSDAIDSYDKALEINPLYAEAWNNRAECLYKLGNSDASIASSLKAIEAAANYAEAYSNLGITYAENGLYEDALKAFGKVLQLDSSVAYALGNFLHMCMRICRWKDFSTSMVELRSAIGQRKKASNPFPLLGLPVTLAEQMNAAITYSKNEFYSGSTLEFVRNNAHPKIKIAYLSADYHNHATAYLMAELFELHDRSRFEVIGICYGHPSSDEIRLRLAQGFDQFIEVAEKSNQEIAHMLQGLEIDIAVDLKGYTQDNRLGVFAHRAAPIQIHYLGYPGTIGATFIDYLIADPVLIPPEHQEFYTEKIVYLPDTYQVNDRKRKIAETNCNRIDHGLPVNGFVFACFNNNWKITPKTFDIWINVLRQVEGSVLWLFKDNDLAMTNLISEAEARDVSPERLIFAERLPLDQHLARLKHADLFLDTLYYNAHTTASDALWAGLPVLTMLGNTYASRVAASLLTAIDLPELITHSLPEYQSLAIDLATNPDRLNAINKKLAANRLGTPLFDTPRFTRHLENAYEQMVIRHQQGLPPDHIYVPHA